MQLTIYENLDITITGHNRFHRLCLILIGQSELKVVIPIPERFRQLRAAAATNRVSIGYSGICLFPLDQLQAAQQGYGIIPEGDETDWRPEWVVVGNEELCGDPVFIDIDDDEFPVYTAAHGMENWRPQLLAFSFRHFLQIMEQLQELSRRRANPVQLQNHPVTQEENDAFVEFIRHQSPDVDFHFWRGLYDIER